MVVNDDLQSYYESVLWLAVADRPALSVYVVSMEQGRITDIQNHTYIETDFNSD